MTEAEFWDLIADKIERNGAELDISALEDDLREGPPERVAAFAHHFDRFHQLSYLTRIWGAAYLINGGCSDDGFDYFRGWLIGMGEDVFTAALEDPDTLAEVAEEDAECEDLLSLGYSVYEDLTGNELEPAEGKEPRDDDDDWDFEDDRQMRKRYPQLYAMVNE